VNEEVRDYKMVVDAGCMKCMDCVDVCPKGALYWGMGRPSVAARGVSKSEKKFDYTWGEEVILALLFLGSLYCWRGLWDAVPFLLSVGLSAISAYILFVATRLFRTPNVRVQRTQAKSHGRWARGGVVIALAGGLLLAFHGYAAVVQYHSREGVRLHRTGHALTKAESRRAIAHLDLAVRLTPFVVADWEGRLGSLLLLDGANAAAATHLARAASVTDAADTWFALGRARINSGDLDGAENALRRALARQPSHSQARLSLAEAIARRGDARGALSEARKGTIQTRGEAILVASIALDARDPVFALEVLETALQADPTDLALLRMKVAAVAMMGRVDEEIRRLIRMPPDDIPAWYYAALLYAERGDLPTARSILSRLKRADPSLEIPEV
jgi:cytochrome c-type biogenesis protein CcmH/NrfG